MRLSDDVSCQKPAALAKLLLSRIEFMRLAWVCPTGIPFLGVPFTVKILCSHISFWSSFGVHCFKADFQQIILCHQENPTYLTHKGIELGLTYKTVLWFSEQICKMQQTNNKFQLPLMIPKNFNCTNNIWSAYFAPWILPLQIRIGNITVDLGITKFQSCVSNSNSHGF